MRNPTWARDELILALDLYFQYLPTKINKNHPAVVELSEVLNTLPIHTDRPNKEKFRNPNGVYMKMCNFLRFDPGYSGKGLSAGGKSDQEVWDEFAGDQDYLRSLALNIRSITGSEESEKIRNPSYDEDDSEAVEGRVLFRVHRVRERNQSLSKKKKNAELKKSGNLACEVCGFIFKEKYGELGKGFIECHHKIPLADLHSNQKTRLSDLALVCSNCHRMLHRQSKMSIGELRSQIWDINK